MRADVLEKGMPSAPEAERAVLGAILRDGEAFPQVAAVLKREDFETTATRTIFGALEDLHAKGQQIDRVCLAQHLEDAGKLQTVGGISGLLDLDEQLTAVLGVEGYVKIVREKSVLRQTLVAIEGLKRRILLGGEQADSLITESELILRDLSSRVSDRSGLRLVSEIVSRLDGGVDALLSPDRERDGIPTGLQDLDALLTGGGFRPGQLIVLAGRPGKGKTALMGQIALHAATRSKAVGIWSLEMDDISIIRRMLCNFGRVNASSFYRGWLSAEERKQLYSATSTILQSPVYIDESMHVTLAQVHASLRRQAAERPIDMAVVDYIGLVKGMGRSENRTQEVSAISRGLKAMAREFRIPFLVLSQLSRLAADVEPELHHLKETGSIEQDADTVLLIHDLMQGKEIDKHTTGWGVDLLMKKQRNGPNGTVPLWFERNTTSFRPRTDSPDDQR